MLSKILKNSSWLIGGRIIGDGLSFLFYIYLARVFGEKGLGNYSFAFATAALLGIGVEFGLRTLVTRDVAKNLPEIPKYRSNLLLFQLALFLFFGAILYIITLIFDYSVYINTLLAFAFLGISLRGFGMSFLAFLEAADEMGKSSLVEVVSKVVIVVFGSILMYLGYSLEFVMFVHVISGFIFLFLSIFLVRKIYGPIIFDFDILLIKKTAITALPFIGASVLYILYSRVDYLMIYHFISEEATGAYSASFRIIETSLLVTSMIGLAIYPSLSRSDAKDSTNRDEIFLLSLKWIAIFSMLGFLILLVAGNDMVLILFGSKFSTSASLIQWMSILIFIGGVKVPYWRLLFAVNKESTQLRIQALSVAINITLNLILIPIYGVVGAIIASIISEVYLLVEFHLTCSKIIVVKKNKKIAGFILLSLLLAIVGLFLKDYIAWYFVVSLVTCSFFISLFLMNMVSNQEKDKVISLIKKLTH
jgi:O-antigen/teichoic acid export membrane protein